ncbi:MAG: hypothetical protein ACE5D7_10670 [Fidelibacterota bacterium]
MRKSIIILVGIITVLLLLVACNNNPVSDTQNTSGTFILTGDITENTTWYAENAYILAGQTFVKPGVTLTIEAGTTIRANADDGNGLAPALTIERGAMIIADGRIDAPITFTSNLPDSELPQRGTWGGLILLGNAPINIDGGESFVEGLIGVPYGGEDENDNSGILRYVRVWYGGRSIGQDNEINGISLAGVGRGTTIEHCEVAWTLDDGFEMFGGTVDLKYCTVLFEGDDAFDTDLGYRGRGQFLFAMLGNDDGNRGFEMDNKANGDMNAQPRSHPQFHNVTLIGSGANSPADNDQMIRLREGTGGEFRNLLIVDGKEYGINITDAATLALLGTELNFSANNIVYNCTMGQFKSDYGLAAQNVDPLLRSIAGRESGGLIDPRPSPGNPALTGGETLPADGFFTQTEFVGAFGDELWIAGWSWLAEMGRLP